MPNSRSWLDHPLAQIVLARVKEFTREPEAVFWVCVFPVMMVIALGLAFRSQKVDPVTVDVTTTDPFAVATTAALEAFPDRFQVKSVTETEAANRLRTGRTDLLVRVAKAESPSANPAIDASDITAAHPLRQARFTYHFDPTQPKSLLARNAVDDALQRAAGRDDVAAVADVEQTEPGGRYIDFLVPGLLGMSLMGGGLWGVGFITVDMRIRKLLKRFLATPMKKSQFLGGIMLGRLAFLLPEVLILLLCSWLIFGVKVYGSWFELLLLIFLGAFTFSGLGLLVASRANTIEMVSGLMNLVMVPMWIFSGIFFSSDKYPDFMQPFIQTLPLTAMNKLLRSVMQEGKSIFELPDLGSDWSGWWLSNPGAITILLIWGIVSFVLALRWFRWT